MNQKIVCIESPDFMIHSLGKIAEQKGDQLFLLTSDKKRLKNANTFFVDVRSDFEAACDIIKNQIGTPDAIITSQEMFLTQTASLAHEFNLLNESPEDITNFRDKSSMKQLWERKGVQTPYSQFYKSYNEIKEKLDKFNFPLVIKPSSGYASCGVKKINTSSEMKEQIRKIFLLNSTVVAKENMNNLGVLVEEYIDGEEFSIDTIWFEGEPICSGILSKGYLPGPYFPDGLYKFEPLLSTEIQNKIKELSFNAVQAMGLRNGATHTEIRFKGNEPYVIETTCRPGAGGIFYDLFNKAIGINFYEAYYNALVSKDKSYLTEIKKQSLLPLDTSKSYFWYNIPHKGQGVIKEIIGLDELHKRHEIESVLCYKKEGSTLYQDDLNTDYFCSVVGVLEDDSEFTMEELIQQYDRILEVNYR